MQRKEWMFMVAAGLSAGLLELPFPLAGPLPPWRAIFAWFALTPLLWAILTPVRGERPLRRAFLLAYGCGVLWYAGNCYWIYDTMRMHGGLPRVIAALLLAGFSVVLGLYFGLFGLCVALVREASGSTRLALAAAPAVWVALELAAARITSVPWDQLGYSQVDNTIVNQLAPWTGVYGISFVLVAVNALIAAGWVVKRSDGGRWWALAGALLLAILGNGWLVSPARQASSAAAVLVQPNLDVTADNTWGGPEWDRHLAEFIRLGNEQCKTYIAGIPQTGAANGEIVCPPYATHPDLVVWPEAPAPFSEADPHFQQSVGEVARALHAPVVVGSVGMDFSVAEQDWHDFNSAFIVGVDGSRVGRYDKIHLVPFGEYVPFSRLLFFAHKLTGRVAQFTPGEERKVFRINGHRYGVFICYESVFADEVREFSELGAEALVNISDDGWYGDTSAPWQHLNMARMRAIENRRWILRDTNTGVTAAIDPEGRVRQSIARHQVDALPAEYGFRDDVTFYTAHGDVFGWGCAILALSVVAWSARVRLRLALQIKARS